jgi:hypothetical protein
MSPARRKRIFIVYASHEEKLADCLKNLLEYWGLEAFYCRQELRETGPAEGYRKLLREKLASSDLVILLLSLDFQWSRYCQAEAGATATLPKKQIVVMIPPAKRSEIQSISPVLEGFDVLTANNPKTPGSEPHQFLTDLKIQVNNALNSRLGKGQWDVKENELSLKLEEELTEAIDDYVLNRPKKEPLSIWSSIDDSNNSACHSIIENIKNSLRNGKPVTKLTFVGVSLKFSLSLLTKALEEFAHEAKAAKRSSEPKKIKRQPKKLEITLVHMDDHSHLLHALEDTIDIENILNNFYRDWPNTIQTWKLACESASITLAEPVLHRIDYIPPRVGILIDDSVFYAGRCSFPRAGTRFKLLVGEREYFFYNETDDRGNKAIREFKDFLEVYSKPNHNGVVLVSDRDTWLRHLQSCVDSYPNIKDATLISQTATKFENLIISSIGKGMHVNIYVQHPDMVSGETQADILSLPKRVKDGVLNREHGSQNGTATIYYYKHAPTFRAALIGEAVLGVQMYVHSNAESRTIKAGALRLIATQYSSQFKDLREGLIGSFLKSPTVSRDPACPPLI